MSKILLLTLLSFLLTGCFVSAREPVTYTQSEIDAINARIQCKALARTLVQIYRCEGGR